MGKPYVPMYGIIVQQNDGIAKSSMSHTFLEFNASVSRPTSTHHVHEVMK
jgi:hypothetical protein